MSNSAVRSVAFDYYRETLILCPWGVAESPVDVPLDWFADALIMVDREWVSLAYPYGAPAVAVSRELVHA